MRRRTLGAARQNSLATRGSPGRQVSQRRSAATAHAGQACVRIVSCERAGVLAIGEALRHLPLTAAGGSATSTTELVSAAIIRLLVLSKPPLRGDKHGCAWCCRRSRATAPPSWGASEKVEKARRNLCEGSSFSSVVQ